MRPIIAALVAFFVSVSTAAGADRALPYKAYITADDVYIRSGPGENYYPTEKLKAGTEVEVYRHDPGGWYAIRPLPESFSWISSRYAKPGKDGLAEVTADKVASRVGSQFSDIREVTQVRLDRGELVELRGSKKPSLGDTAVQWYRIAPPAGEFRWVYGKYVDADFPRDGVNKASADASRLIQHGSSSAGLAGPVGTTPAASAAGALNAAGPTLSPADAASRPADGSVQVPANAIRQYSPEQFQAELDRINAELSVMLVEEPTVWNTRELTVRAQNLLDQSQTAVDRGRARAIVNRLAQAEDVRRRFETIHVAKADLDARNRQLASVERLRPDGRGSAPAGRYDGTGRLTRVLPPKTGSPRYALVDERGNIRTYVTPAPGMNLNYYVGRTVGVTGSRTYLPEQQAAHVTARNVAPLEPRLR